MKAALEVAKSDAEVAKILEIAKGRATAQQGKNKSTVEGIIAEAKGRVAGLPALKDQIPRAEKYGKEIQAKADGTLNQAIAAADLMSLAKDSMVALDAIMATLGQKGSKAEDDSDRDGVKAALSEADKAAEAQFDTTVARFKAILDKALGADVLKNKDREQSEIEEYGESLKYELRRRIDRYREMA